MQIISVLAQKGGAGKTTLALHWAVQAELKRKTAAVIDTDPQGSAAAWGQRRQKETPHVLKADETNLKEAVQACRANGLDYVFIDTMPRVERPSFEAARLADLVVIPCAPSIVDIEAISATVDIVQRARKPAVIVLNHGRSGSTINEKALGVLKQYGIPLCPTVVMRRAALADAFTDGRAVSELDPGCKGALEIRESWSWLEKQLKNTR